MRDAWWELVDMARNCARRFLREGKRREADRAIHVADDLIDRIYERVRR